MIQTLFTSDKVGKYVCRLIALDHIVVRIDVATGEYALSCTHTHIV